MITLKEWNFKLKLVRTRRGAILHVIELDKNHFWIEQNPLKDSKYGYAYRKIKAKFPEFYMFWEIKDDKYTGRLLAGAILEKKEIDEFISDVLQSEEYKKYEDVLEKIENEQEAEQNK